MRAVIFLLAGIFLTAPASAFNVEEGIVPAEAGSIPQVAENPEPEEKHRHTFCDLLGNTVVPEESAASPCGEAVKSVRKRAAYWLRQAKGAGDESKGCRHFQTAFEFAGARYHQAKAVCRNTRGIQKTKKGEMLDRNAEGQEVKDNGIARLKECASQMRKVFTRASNQLGARKEAGAGFKDRYTATDLESAVGRDLKKMKTAKVPAMKNQRQALRCRRVLRDSLLATESLGRFYGTPGVRHAFEVLRDQASLDLNSALAAEKQVKAVSGPGPQPLKNDDPRWAR